MTSKAPREKIRTLEQFIEDQVKFEEKRFERLKKLIEEEDSQVKTYFKPQVSKGTQKLVEQKGN